MALIKEQEMDIMNFLQIIWRRKGLILIFLIVALLVGVFLNYLISPRYRATVSLLLTKPRYNFDFYRPGEPKIGTRPIPLESVEVLESLIKDGNLVNKVREALILKDNSYNQLKSEDLLSMINMRMDKDMGILDLKIDNNDPGTAAQIAEIWSSQLVEQIDNLDDKENKETRVFLKTELAQAQTDLTQAEQELKKFESRSSVELYQKELSAKINNLNNIELDLVKEVEMENEIKNYLAQVDKKIKGKNDSANSLVLANKLFLQNMQNRILRHENNFSEIKFDVDRGQIPEPRDMYPDNQITYRSDQIFQMDNSSQDFEQQISALTMILNSIISRKNYLRGYVPVLKKECRQLKEKYSQENLQKLQLKRVTDTARSTYAILVQKSEEMRVSAGTTTGQLKIIKAAAVPLNPYLPKKKINILVSLFFGLALGLMSAMTIERGRTE